MQQSPYTTNPIFENISNAFRTVSEWPGKIIEFGEEQNRRIIEIMQGLQGSAGAAGDGLRRTQLRQTGGDVMEWIVNNQGLLMAIVAAIIAVFIFKK